MPSYKYQEFIFSVLMLVAGLVLVAHSYSEACAHSLIGDGAMTPMFHPPLFYVGYEILRNVFMKSLNLVRPSLLSLMKCGIF